MAKQTTKEILASNWNPVTAVPVQQVEQAAQNYANVRKQELNGSGICDQFGPSWPVQVAANSAATQRGAAAAASEAKRIKARQNFKQPTTKKGK